MSEFYYKEPNGEDKVVTTDAEKLILLRCPYCQHSVGFSDPTPTKVGQINLTIGDRAMGTIWDINPETNELLMELTCFTCGNSFNAKSVIKEEL